MNALTIQLACDDDVPSEEAFETWVNTALEGESKDVTIRIVDIPEMTQLNETYRQKKGPTNVLSFPFEWPEGVPTEQTELGDIVICASVVKQEATQQKKNLDHHWAHMVIHGVLHLLGYDHQTDSEADIMEKKEVKLLTTLGFIK